MNAVFFTSLTVFLVIVQTVILPSFSWFSQCFDLLIINVLFLSFNVSHSFVVVAIIVIGCIMDSLSGVPFCYHVFSYVWIYIIVRIARQLLFQRSLIFTYIISLVGVCIQHGLLLFSMFVSQGSAVFRDFNFGLLIRQELWAVVLIPPGVWFVTVCWHNWNFIVKFLQKQIAQKSRG